MNRTQLVSLVFALFFLMVIGIYSIGKQLHSDNSGLSESLSKEYIVQYFIRVNGVSIDARAEQAAAKAQIGQETVVKILLNNLEETAQKFSVEAKQVPDNRESIEWTIPNEPQVIGAHEKKEVVISYKIKSDALHTKDGTIDFIFMIQSN